MNRRFAGSLVAIALVVTGLVVSQTASAANFTGGFAPTIFNLKADLNGDNAVDGRDDSVDFYGDTEIIDGQLDCSGWGTGVNDVNDGSNGDQAITGDDDCTLLGYDGTSDGVLIQVANGFFITMDGAAIPNGTRLPLVFPEPNQPDNPSVIAARFAWSTISGRVNTDGNEFIDQNDCAAAIIGIADDAGLGNPAALGNVNVVSDDAACTGLAVDESERGLVDLNGDLDITAVADTCTNSCFFGHNVTNGFVQAEGTGTGTGTGTGVGTGTGTGVGTGTGTGTTIPPGSLRVGDVGGATISTDCVFTVNLTSPLTNEVRVNYVSEGGGNQVAPTSGQLTFAPGQTTKTVTVDVIKQKRFTRGSVDLVLTNPSGASISDDRGTCTIKRRPRRARRTF